MSKPSSGLFHGTNGDKEESKQIKFDLSNINDNIKKLDKKFQKTKSGYFGESGKSSKVRVIKSNNQYKTAQEFWKILSKGGYIKILPNKHGLLVNFSDDSYATYRVKTSTKGSPAIEINIKNSSDTKSQKIHFISKGVN